LTDLKPNKDYEINLLFIPYDSNQSTTLKSEKPIFIKTSQEDDAYRFNIELTPGTIKETTAELVVNGVPHPEDKYVNIYQVIFQSDAQKEQKSYFKVPKRDSNKKATLTDLKPGTR